ncbi:MAG: CARDB domain-containing protein, partial [Myxococcales bacterium]
YLGVVVDPTDVVDEAIETNNTGVSAPYSAGVDLVGTISCPAAVALDGPIEVALTVRNLGLDASGPFDFQVFFSRDETLDASDVLAQELSGSIQGLGPGETLTQTLRTPTAPGGMGAWRFILVVDPQLPGQPEGRVTEVDETNNVALSNEIVVSAADLVPVAVSVRSPVEPHPELTSALFGDEVQVAVEVTNTGIESPHSFDLWFVLSDNPVISVYDQALAEVTDMTLAAGASLSVDVDVTLPVTAPDGVPWPDGSYYLGVIVDIHGAVLESNERNNLASSAPVALAHGAVSCAQASECESGFCVDGFCCNTACGGGDPDDCQACSVSAGAQIDGRCGPVGAGAVCRASSGACDVEERCDGASLACPADAMAAAGTACDDGDACTFDDTCDGNGTCSGVNACQPDAGTPFDAGEGDAGQDAGSEADAGGSDAGVNDAGAADAGKEMDASVAEDAGEQPEDASVAPPDGGQPGDAGEPDSVVAQQPGGCGCGASAGGLDAAVALLVVTAGWWRRRRRE